MANINDLPGVAAINAQRANCSGDDSMTNTNADTEIPRLAKHILLGIADGSLHSYDDVRATYPVWINRRKKYPDRRVDRVYFVNNSGVQIRRAALWLEHHGLIQGAHEWKLTEKGQSVVSQIAVAVMQ